ncbi:MAG TPA: CpsD/CapB family tyrosine-protein kinase, partial [Ktedonobacteraceae bacterium]|nr:CpsD/CapB family tyrosine-protein kinase [Ktedonobacteraceae bacterium]
QTTAEKYRMICSRLNVVQANQPFKLIMFTSASAGEGKSCVASNTAVYLAQMGKQVLLVDLHIHRPELARIFHLSNQPGLTNLLIGGDKQLRLEACLQATETPGLSVLPIGSQPMNSTEQLQSLIATQFFSQLQQTSFDYVVFDSPPLLSVAETPLLASSMEAVVLVVNGSQTTRRMLMRTRQLLRRMQTTRIIGVVINQSFWRDYADTHLYTLPSPQLEDKLQDKVEQETLEMPAITTMLLPTAKTPMEPPKRRLPDTGETEQVRSRIPEYIIQPTLSLSGLSAPGNGLTRRVFSSETPSTVPQSLPNG